MTSSFGRAVRGQFQLEPQTAYLTHGTFGAVPRVVYEAAEEWRRRCEVEPVRFFQKEMPPALDAARAALAARLGAELDGLVMVENATAGMNTVLASIDFAPGDEVLTTDHVYNAVRTALRHWAVRRGAVLIEAPVPFPLSGPQVVVDAIAERLSPRTRLIAIDHVTSSTALIFPVDQIVRLARERGIAVLVDGAHAPGMLPIDLRALGADWYVGNCHKWLFAPRGSGFLYAAQSRRATTHPLVISHSYGEGMVAEFDWVGTRDCSPWLVVPDALRFAESHGLEAIARHNRSLLAAAVDLIAQRWGVVPPSPLAMRGFMATLPLPVEGPATVERALEVRDQVLERHGVEVPMMPFGGRLWTRISAQIFNERDEYQLLAEALAPAA